MADMSSALSSGSGFLQIVKNKAIQYKADIYSIYEHSFMKFFHDLSVQPKITLMAFGIAILPAFVWLYLLFSDSKKRKSIMLFVFIGGILTITPLLLMQGLFATYDKINVLTILPKEIPNIKVASIAIIVFLAMMEEIFKQTFLRKIDNRYLLVETVNDSIRFAMIAAMGFSFAENIYPYFYRLLQYGQYKELIPTFFIRSLFTAAMHISVSGIFGYYYGISKFAIDFRQQSKWTGQRLYLTQWISKLLNIPQSEAFREQKILRGLFIAMGIHGAFNALVEYNLVLPALILVIGSFVYLMLLLKRKAGELALASEVSGMTDQGIARREEDVITELIGVWFNEKRFTDVVQICDRLLKRNPDNSVVKIFRAKAVDKLEGNDTYNQVATAIGSKKTTEDQSMLKKWIDNKEGTKNVPQNFQSSSAYKKFLEEEEKKKEGEQTFRLK